MDLTDETKVIDGTHLFFRTHFRAELFRKVRFDEILEDLKVLGVDVREQTLKNPTTEEALGLYGLAIQVIFGKTRTDIRPEDVYSQIHVYSSGVEGLEITSDNLEFLKRGVGNLRFWRFCQKLHQALGLPDIERYELFNPTPESFHRFISAFVVYLRFRDALKSLFEDAIARLNFCAEQEEQLEDNIGKVQQELQNFKRLKEENANDIVSSVGDREQLEGRLLQAKGVFNEHKEEKAKVDAEIERVKQTINDVQLKKTKARHRNEMLCEQIVSEPDSLYSQKDELEAQEVVQNATLKNLTEEFDETQRRFKLLEDCGQFVEDVKTKMTQHLDEVLKPLVENLSAARTLKARNETLQEQINRQKEQRDNARAEFAAKRQLYEEKIRLLQEAADNELKAARKFSEDTRDEVRKMQQTISQEKVKVDSLKREFEVREEKVTAVFSVAEASWRKVTYAAESYARCMDEIMDKVEKVVKEE
ncbi:Nuf2 [Babesia ovata]|uniref:Nuf2 n=1 Tax=Babesia ovata TaxID=189622 RepID=A0A2H6KDI2_9APIC|nr:Nuf2 [Babesia ovata]GBE61047.1 Nuf2 [Babesia ovata]